MEMSAMGRLPDRLRYGTAMERMNQKLAYPTFR
jgi:hypothetical protein